jgi:5-methylcytosine-specific restriction endonuclease McrA
MPGVGSVACPKPASRFQTRKARKLARDAHWREVCRLVDLRDGHRCRVCGRWTNPDSLTLLERGHRHHLIYRSAGGPDESWNVATLCPECHDDEHSGKIRLTGNADVRDAGSHRLCGICVERPTDGVWEVVAWV